MNLRGKIVRRIQARHADLPLPISINRKCVYILPTPFGLFYAAVVLIILFGSLNYNNNLGLILSFTLIGIGLLAAVQTQKNLTGMLLVAVTPRPSFAGDECLFRLRFINQQRAAKQDILVEAGDSQSALTLEANREAEVRLHRPCPTRGWRSLGMVKISTEFPFGLFRSWSWVGSTTACLIYPHPETNPPPPPIGGRSGGRGLATVGDEEFEGLRDFQPGDPMRLIAWKAVAHTNTLKSKTFSTPTQPELDFQWETAGTLDDERKLSRLCAWICLAANQDRRYRLALPDQVIGPAIGEQHRDQCLKQLALQPGFAGQGRV